MFTNTEELLIVWLDELADGNIGVEMGNDPLTPFFLVTRLVSTDDKVTELATCDVEVFHKSRDVATDIARAMHQRMLALTPKTVVQLSNASVRVDSVETLRGPAWSDYQDENLERVLARYEIASRINSQPL